MFFKREKPRVHSFSERLDRLRGAGYVVESADGGALARRHGFAALLKEGPGGTARIEDPGLAIGNELAVLTDLGFQKIFLAPGGRKTPALAEHLRGLHRFVEDLREDLGLISLYNEALGTVNEKHLYDRVRERDQGVARRPWERR